MHVTNLFLIFIAGMSLLDNHVQLQQIVDLSDASVVMHGVLDL